MHVSAWVNIFSNICIDLIIICLFSVSSKPGSVMMPTWTFCVQTVQRTGEKSLWVVSAEVSSDFISYAYKLPIETDTGCVENCIFPSFISLISSIPYFFSELVRRFGDIFTCKCTETGAARLGPFRTLKYQKKKQKLEKVIPPSFRIQTTILQD